MQDVKGWTVCLQSHPVGNTAVSTGRGIWSQKCIFKLVLFILKPTKEINSGDLTQERNTPSVHTLHQQRTERGEGSSSMLAQHLSAVASTFQPTMKTQSLFKAQGSLTWWEFADMSMIGRPLGRAEPEQAQCCGQSCVTAHLSAYSPTFCLVSRPLFSSLPYSPWLNSLKKL